MLHRPLRKMRGAGRHLANLVRIAWLRCLYPGLNIGKGVLIGRNVDIAVLDNASLEIADGTAIQRGCILHSEGRLRIGSNSFIGLNTVIVALEAIEIGPDALIAANCTIRDQDHGTGSFPYRTAQSVSSPVIIGENVWLGAGVVVTRGTKIGDHCVIGANAVVTKSLPERTIAVGVPAKAIPSRALVGN